MLSKDELQSYCELAQLAPGDLRYSPTHYAGGRVTIEVAGRNDVVFVARSSVRLEPREGDTAVAYANRLTAAANALPRVLDHIGLQERRIARLEVALHETAASVHLLRLPLREPHTMKSIADTIERTALAALDVPAARPVSEEGESSCLDS